jgi:hypothetical protein
MIKQYVQGLVVYPAKQIAGEMAILGAAAAVGVVVSAAAITMFVVRRVWPKEAERTQP